MIQMYWYRIDIDFIKDIYVLYGSSLLSPEELADALAKPNYIKLSDLVYNDRGKFVDWQNWDPRHQPIKFINPARVISFQELTGDPRQVNP